MGKELLRNAAEADNAMGRKNGDRDGLRAGGRDGGSGGEGRQLCPTCRGTGEVPKFFAGQDADGGFSTNRMVRCGTCDGMGNVAGRTR
ncbi:hypothetical protein FDG2_1645 [Candidatus Protofrankia californiensis]|uniref:Uncharacterized protein n=1 Tax=Candidatus Protofrankia californiensis TaxID=1839754 RepID=A0A1C3NW08_9ACTN|nr:hypothetical protein FDG2_1645 [Candidatus Protofrankia californiensis]